MRVAQQLVDFEPPRLDAVAGDVQPVLLARDQVERRGGEHGAVGARRDLQIDVWAEEYYGASFTLADVAERADTGVRSHGRNRLSERDVLVLQAALSVTGRFTSSDGWHYRLIQGAPKQALLSHDAKTAAVWFRDCLVTVGDVAEASTASDLRASYAAFASLPAPGACLDNSGASRCPSTAGASGGGIRAADGSTCR